MDDHELERDLDEVGRAASPDLEAARRGVDARLSGPRRGGGFLRSTVLTVAVAGALAAGLVTTLALRGTHGSAPAAPAVAGPASTATSSSTGAAGSAGDAATSAPEATANGGGAGTASPAQASAVPITIEPVHSLPPATLVPATPTPPSRTPAAAGGNVVLTPGSAGSVAVTRGETVEVDLPASSMPWTQPQSTDSAVLVRVSASTGADGSAHALFRAVADGTVSVVAAQQVACVPRCLPPDRAWDVTVTVTG